MIYHYPHAPHPDNPQQDQQLIDEFSARREAVREFIKRKVEIDAIHPLALNRIRPKLCAIVLAREADLARSFSCESYLCPDCDLPHRLVYKHPTNHRCPCCQDGLMYGPDTVSVQVLYQDVLTFQFLGETVCFYDTVIHTLHPLLEDKKLELTEEQLAKLMPRYEHFETFIPKELPYDPYY